jgi:electron transfer flavoprotein beta subunit
MIARENVLEWTGFLSVPTLVVTLNGKDYPYLKPKPLEQGKSPRGVNRGSIITEPTGKLKVERVLDDGFQSVEVGTPAVVSISNEFGEPRYPQLRQIMLAAKKTVQVWGASDLGIGDQLGAANRELTLEALYVPKVESNVEIIEGDSPEEKARNLAQKLRAAKLI